MGDQSAKRGQGGLYYLSQLGQHQDLALLPITFLTYFTITCIFIFVACCNSRGLCNLKFYCRVAFLSQFIGLILLLIAKRVFFSCKNLIQTSFTNMSILFIDSHIFWFQNCKTTQLQVVSEHNPLLRMPTRSNIWWHWHSCFHVCVWLWSFRALVLLYFCISARGDSSNSALLLILFPK